MNEYVKKEVDEMLSLIERIENKTMSKGGDILLEANDRQYTFEEDELMEYTYIDKNVSGLSVDCFADDGGSYRMRGHDMWFLFRNSYKRDTNDVIPILVSRYPKILGKHKKRISDSDISKILDFVAINCNTLSDLANDKLTHREFFNNLKPINTIYECVSNDKVLLYEMSYIRPSVTGLPMVI